MKELSVCCKEAPSVRLAWVTFSQREARHRPSELFNPWAVPRGPPKLWKEFLCSPIVGLWGESRRVWWRLLELHVMVVNVSDSIHTPEEAGGSLCSLRDSETGWPVKCCKYKCEPECDPQHSCGKDRCGGTHLDFQHGGRQRKSSFQGMDF